MAYNTALTSLIARIMPYHPIQILTILIDFIEALPSKDWEQRHEVFFVHGGDVFQRKVLLGPFATGAPIYLMNILRGPDELIHISASITGDSVNIILRERTPIGCNDGSSAH